MVTTLRKQRQRLKGWIEHLSDNHPAKLSFYVFLFACIAVVALTFIFYGYDSGFYENILVEAHGMLFDLLIIGAFLFWLQSLGEKRRDRRINIQRYQEEIEDYLPWDEPEAAHRIAGNIKRLNREGISKIYLSKANLSGAILDGVNLMEADLYGAYLEISSLRGANLSGAILNDVNLYLTDLEEADLSKANLRNANLYQANLEGANLQSANLEGANLEEANLSGANLEGAILTNANLKEVNLEGARCKEIIWPADFDPGKAGIRSVED